jgi:hypothetical protein
VKDPARHGRGVVTFGFAAAGRRVDADLRFAEEIGACAARAVQRARLDAAAGS